MEIMEYNNLKMNNQAWILWFDNIILWDGVCVKQDEVI
jgi:hypothetical protein